MIILIVIKEWKMGKPILDILFEKFEKSLPKQLQPHAFKIVFGAIVVCLLSPGGWYYGFNILSAFLNFVTILYGAGLIWILLKWLFTKN